MTISTAVIPLLEGDAARAIMDDFEKTKLRPYTEEERICADRKVEEILMQKKSKK